MHIVRKLWGGGRLPSAIPALEDLFFSLVLREILVSMTFSELRNCLPKEYARKGTLMLI